MAKGKLQIATDKCKGCNLCVTVCPVKCLALDTTKVNKKGYNPMHVIAETCVACGSCGIICPDNVIIVERTGE